MLMALFYWITENISEREFMVQLLNHLFLVNKSDRRYVPFPLITKPPENTKLELFQNALKKKLESELKK